MRILPDPPQPRFRHTATTSAAFLPHCEQRRRGASALSVDHPTRRATPDLFELMRRFLTYKLSLVERSLMTPRSQSGRSASEKPTSPFRLRTVHFGKQRIAEQMRPLWRSAKSQRSYTWSGVHSACSAEDWPPDGVVHRCKALQLVCIPHLVYRRGPRVSQLLLDDHRRALPLAMRSQQEHLP
jgi:hypothetical protein